MVGERPFGPHKLLPRGSQTTEACGKVATGTRAKSVVTQADSGCQRGQMMTNPILVPSLQASVDSNAGLHSYRYRASQTGRPRDGQGRLQVGQARMGIAKLEGKHRSCAFKHGQIVRLQ